MGATRSYVTLWLASHAVQMASAAPEHEGLAKFIMNGLSGNSLNATSSQNDTGSVDECFSSWDKYWSASQLATSGTYSIEPPYTTTRTISVSNIPGTTYTYTSSQDATVTVKDGEFPIETETIHTTTTITDIEPAIPGYTSTNTYTVTESTQLFPSNTVPKPDCKLPTYVSQCESQWSTWISTQLVPAPTPPPNCDINAGLIDNKRPVPPCASAYQSAESSWNDYINTFQPACTQASIGGDLCQSVRDNYVHGANLGNLAVPELGMFFSAGYVGNFKDTWHTDFNVSYSWPTSSTIGSIPSCTLGCGRCAVTGGTVQLIYWPATPSPTNNASAKATGPVTIETLGTTFTSPTMYISYGHVYAANGCQNVGSTITNTIVAIPTNSPLSSIYGLPRPCDAHNQNGFTQEETFTASFNVTDLNEPVPYSIYSSQPWCATYSFDNNCQGTCPTDRPYKPLLVVPEEVLQDMEPAWSTCYGDIRGVYDPPIALHPATSVQGVTRPNDPGSNPPTATPQPASGGSPSMPTPTSVTPQSDSLPTTSQNIGNVIASLLHQGTSGSAPTGSGSPGNDPSNNDPSQSGGAGHGGSSQSPSVNSSDARMTVSFGAVVVSLLLGIWVL